MKFHPDVLAAHAEFGGELEAMQALYDRPEHIARIAELEAEVERLRKERDDLARRILSALEPAAPEGRQEAGRIGDAVLDWMVKFYLLDAGNEYYVSDVLSVLNDLAPSTRPTEQAVTEDDVAARLWKAEAEDVGAPASIADNRTRAAFDNQSDELKARWRKFAKAAMEARNG